MDDDEDLGFAEDLDAIAEQLSEEDAETVAACLRVLRIGRSLTTGSRRKLKIVWKKHLGGDADDDVDEGDFI